MARSRGPENYAESTHGSKWWIIRYAHERRGIVAAEMMGETHPEIILDWGTGDGRVLELLLDRPDPPALVLAYEPHAGMQKLLAELQARHPLGDRIVVFAEPDEIATYLDGRKLDVIACLGVLEHLPLAPRRVFYDFTLEHLAEGGTVLVDVPVEIGPAVVLKEAARRLLKGRPAEYKMRDLVRRAFGLTKPDPVRFVDDGSTGFLNYHRDFDHRLLIDEMSSTHELVERKNTPVPLLPSWCFNQEVLFRAVPKKAPSRS